MQPSKNNFSATTFSKQIQILQNKSSGITDLILITIFLIITALYFLLLIKDNVPTIGLVILGVSWMVYWVLSGRLSFSTPMDQAIICFIALIPLSLYISIDLPLSILKVYGLVLGVAIFYLIVNSIRNLQGLKLSILALIFLSLAISMLGLLGADWSGSSFTLPSRVLNRLGQLIPLIQNISTGGGIHVNTVGGTLTFFVPLLVSLLWDEKSIKRTFFYPKKNAKKIYIISKLTILVALVVVLAILILTQSRGSYLGVFVGLFVLIIWKKPNLYWLIPMLIVITIAVFLVFADGNIYNFISLLDTSQEGDTLQTRLDYWQRTIYLIQDFPFTGVGLGTYGKVFDAIYTFTPFSLEGQRAFYAHNMYLALAASMGLPALMLYIALFSSTAMMAITTYRKVRSVAKVLLMGLSCGILANLIYGLWDNYLLGEKLAVVLWVYLAMINAIYIHQGDLGRRYSVNPNQSFTPAQKEHVNNKNSNWFVNFFFGLGCWVLFSLIAIAFVNINEYVSLVITIFGGILLGILLTRRYKVVYHCLQPGTTA